MKHPNFAAATILFMLAMLAGVGSVVEQNLFFALLAGACFFAGIYAAFEGKNNTNDNE